MAIVKVKCGCCDGGKKPFTTGEGKIVPCPYCNDTGKRNQIVPHKSHQMGEWYSDIRCPGSTPRFYSVRGCMNCGAEEMKHSAGHFLDGLLGKCLG